MKNHEPKIDPAITREAVLKKLGDMETAGFQAEFSPHEAEVAGAFVEDALSLQDAIESSGELASQDDDLTPAFITEGEPVADLPAFMDTANVHSLYGWKPGESLDEAIARKKAQEQS